jgi:hypothetical protein
MFNSGYRNSIDSLQEFPSEILELVKQTPAIAPQLAGSLEDSKNKFLYEVTVSVAEGWSNSLWALFYIVAGGALCFILWAPGKNSKRAKSKKERPAKAGLRYREVTTYIEIEGARKKDRISVSQRRYDKL